MLWSGAFFRRVIYKTKCKVNESKMAGWEILQLNRHLYGGFPKFDQFSIERYGFWGSPILRNIFLSEINFE